MNNQLPTCAPVFAPIVLIIFITLNIGSLQGLAGNEVAVLPQHKVNSTTGAKKLDAISWSSGEDKFKSTRWVILSLRGMSKKTADFSMILTSVWRADDGSQPKGFSTIHLGFCKSRNCTDGTLPKNEGILLIDGSTRVNLKGSNSCKQIECYPLETGSDVLPWLVADLSIAKSVEG